jgi:hypothetical protein
VLSKGDSTNHKKISKSDHLMDITNHIALVVIALITSFYPACCEESQFDIYEEFTEVQYKNHIKEFQRAFGKQIEKEFGLKWVEGGFIHDFSRVEPEFYAYRRATLEEARALVLTVIFKLSEAVQADPIMLSYLNKLSITPDFLGLDISFVYSHNWSYDDGSIDSVYSYYSKGNTNDVKKLHLRYDATDQFSDILILKILFIGKLKNLLKTPLNLML